MGLDGELSIQDKARRFDEIKRHITEWVSKQGEEQCWYYPEIFRPIAELCGVDYVDPNLPPRCDFERGCIRFQDEMYSNNKP